MTSPVLRTLTSSFSDDTIWALSITLGFVHLFFSDYGFLNRARRSAHSGNSLALNAAIFASVLLVSRLPSNELVFACMALAVELFALLPLVAHAIHMASWTAHLLFTYSFATAVAVALGAVSAVLLAAFLAALAFVNVLCPLWLLWSQKFKAVLSAQWDIAAVKPLEG
eukprot:PLAT1115.2.p1 GENE.PLAT1115.2~~PLAT1115.2.p1  ORF type:complete len:168 (-),score=59.48 PLAT1115.2:119-622(-)